MYANSFAKINLYLEVLSKRPDSYHEVNTAICSIDLCDSIKYALTKKPHIKLWCNREELASKANLIYKVASLMQEQFRPDAGVEITLEKRIPIAAGLGGGSSNAAVTILALNRLWDLKLSEDTLHEIAASIGSDVNFFLAGGTSLATGRGERIEALKDMVLDHILLVNPGIHISAGSAYGKIQNGYQPRNWADDLAKGRYFNRLEPAIRQEYPEIDYILNKMKAGGASWQMMSGSGSTCFAVFESLEVLRDCQKKFEQDGFWTYMTRTITREEYKKSVFKA